MSLYIYTHAYNITLFPLEPAHKSFRVLFFPLRYGFYIRKLRNENFHAALLSEYRYRFLPPKPMELSNTLSQVEAHMGSVLMETVYAVQFLLYLFSHRGKVTLSMFVEQGHSRRCKT